jgi:hypothetical protein
LNTVTSRSYINYNLWLKNPIIKEAINDKIYTQFLDYLLRIWFPLSSVSVISCADMIRDHDYLQFQWSLIMISSVSGIPDHAYLQYHYYPQWIWYYLQYQKSLIMIIFSISSNLLGRYDQRSRLSSVSVIPDHDLFSIRDPWSWWQSLIMFIFSRLDNTFNTTQIIDSIWFKNLFF